MRPHTHPMPHRHPTPHRHPKPHTCAPHAHMHPTPHVRALSGTCIVRRVPCHASDACRKEAQRRLRSLVKRILVNMLAGPKPSHKA
jgi:hypothetical protein